MSRERNVVDEEDAQAREAQASGLPVEFRAGRDVVGRSMLVKPTTQQVATFSCTRVRTCGGCKFFHKAGFAEVRSDFMAKLIHDYQWRPDFIGDHPSKMGRCSQNEELVTGPNSLACDQFRPK